MPTKTKLKAKSEPTEDSLSDARASAKAQRSTESDKHAMLPVILFFFLISHKLFKFRTTEDLSRRAKHYLPARAARFARSF